MTWGRVVRRRSMLGVWCVAVTTVVGCGSTAPVSPTAAMSAATTTEARAPDGAGGPAPPTTPRTGPRDAPRARWRLHTHDRLVASARELRDGSIVVGSADGHLYRVRDNGDLLFRVPVESAVRSRALAIPDDIIVVGTDAGVLFWVSTQGEVLRRVELVGSVRTDPLLAPDGTIYAAAAGLYAFDSDGTLRFRRVEATTLDHPPQLTPSGHVIYRTPGGAWVTLDRDGRRLNTPDPPTSVAESGVVDSAGVRYDVEHRDTVVGRRRDGQVLFRYTIGAAIDAPLVLSASGALLISAHDGTLYALQ